VKSFLLFLLVLTLAVFAFGCSAPPEIATDADETSTAQPSNEKDTPSQSDDGTDPSQDTPAQDDGRDTQTPKTFDGVTVTPVSATYDGKVHYPTLIGAPNHAAVTYSQDPVSVGTYTVTVTLTADGYEPLSLDAAVVITPASMDLTFESLLAYVDGKTHRLRLSEELPTTATVTYYEESEGVKIPIHESLLAKSEEGTYTFSVTVKQDNYEDFSATATLNIKKTPKAFCIARYGENLFYQNPADKDALYVKNETVDKKITSDVITALYQTKDGRFYGLCTSSEPITLFAFTLSDTFEAEAKQPLLLGNIDEVLFADDTKLYYSVSLGDPGIYEATLDENGVKGNTRIADGHFENLCLNDAKSKLYFTNSDKNGELSFVDISLATRCVETFSGYSFDSLYVHGDYVYGARSGQGTVKVSLLDTAKTVVIADDYGFAFCLFDDKICFITSSVLGTAEGDTVLFCNTTTGATGTLISKRQIPCFSALTLTGGSLFYRNGLYPKIEEIPTEDIPK